MTERLLSSVAFLGLLASEPLAHACAQVDPVNGVIASCYASLQDAIDEAVRSDLPLVLPHGDYQGPVTIDYTRNAGTGFELISRGATIYGGLVVQCERDCFYFHQEGTLFVSGQTSGYLVTIGKPDFSDPQNSIKVDHLVANNGGSGGAVQLNYVLDGDLYIVADSAGAVGLDARQLQFSTLKGSMSAAQGYAMVVEDGYVISNSFLSLDQEASSACLLMTSPHANGNAWIATYQDCAQQGTLSRAAMTGNDGVGGVVGGSTWQTYTYVNE